MHQSISITLNENYSLDEMTKKKTYTFYKDENINTHNLYYFLLHEGEYGQSTEKLYIAMQYL